jgi:hypothetical protein
MRPMTGFALRLFGTTACVLLFLTSCKSGGQPSVAQNACTPGESISCSGPTGCVGSKQCSGTPASFGPCECHATSPNDAGAKASLGATCKKNADCPTGAFCLDAHSTMLFGGAPPEATCVADCSSGAAACQRFAAAVCVATDAAATGLQAKAALCFEACSLGATPEPKCHARAHMACAPIDETVSDKAFCRPLCASDDECASAACDPVHAVCGADKAGDRTFGLRCNPASGALTEPDAGTDLDAGADGSAGVECAGLCVQLNDAPSLCSRRCMFGDAHECAPASGGLRRGGCVFVAKGGSVGDLGYCGELCDCTDDCVEPTFVCDPFKDASLGRAFGRKGVCTDRNLALQEPLACGK